MKLKDCCILWLKDKSLTFNCKFITYHALSSEKDFAIKTSHSSAIYLVLVEKLILDRNRAK